MCLHVTTLFHLGTEHTAFHLRNRVFP
jgi:hypothetical protein